MRAPSAARLHRSAAMAVWLPRPLSMTARSSHSSGAPYPSSRCAASASRARTGGGDPASAAASAARTAHARYDGSWVNQRYPARSARTARPWSMNVPTSAAPAAPVAARTASTAAAAIGSTISVHCFLSCSRGSGSPPCPAFCGRSWAGTSSSAVRSAPAKTAAAAWQRTTAVPSEFAVENVHWPVGTSRAQ